jgi:hypothetical protein
MKATNVSWRRATAWVVAAAALCALAFTPLVAAAVGLDEDPSPSSWPTVAEPPDANSNESDPKPTDPPTVVQPPVGEGTDPTAPDWPGPQEQ